MPRNNDLARTEALALSSASAPRMRWASQGVAALYPPASGTIRDRLTLRARSAAAAARQVVRDHSRHGHTPVDWPIDLLAAA